MSTQSKNEEGIEPSSCTKCKLMFKTAIKVFSVIVVSVGGTRSVQR